MNTLKRISLFSLLAFLQPMQAGEDFPQVDYEKYMQRIEKLDSEIHQKLRNYDEKFKEAAFKKAVDNKGTVLIPKKETHGYPLMVLPEGLSDEELERYLASYRALQIRGIPKEYDSEKKRKIMVHRADAQAKPQSAPADKAPFPSAEHNEYMGIIGEIDPEIYQRLRDYENATSKGLFIVARESARDDDEPEDSARKRRKNDTSYDELDDVNPKDFFHIDDNLRHENKFQPQASLHSLQGFSEAKKRKILAGFVTEYKRVLAAAPIKPLPGYIYECLKKEIWEKDNNLYGALIDCEEANGFPCILEGKSATIHPSPRKGGLPYFIMAKDASAGPYAEHFMNAYRAWLQDNLSLSDRTIILNFIKKLAPELYAEIVAIDPTGKNHIIAGGPEHGIASMIYSPYDGLPILYLHPKRAPSSSEELEWSLGHELAHYLNGDFFSPDPLHKGMHGNEATPQEYAPGKKVTRQFPIYVKKDGKIEKEIIEQLPFEDTMRKARSRAEESQADRDSVTKFGTSVDAGIDLTNRLAKQASADLKMHTFTTTHPISSLACKQNTATRPIADLTRIESLEDLKRELEVYRAPTQKIDWKSIIAGYKGAKAGQPIKEDQP